MPSYAYRIIFLTAALIAMLPSCTDIGGDGEGEDGDV